MVGAPAKRRAIKAVVERGLGTIAQGCRALGLNRTLFYKRGQVSDRNKDLHRRIVETSQEHPRYGYRRIRAILYRDQELCVNNKRIARVRRIEGLQVHKKQKRTRRVGPESQLRSRAQAPNEVWSWDFVHDMTENGTRFRILTLIDEHTRQCLAIRPGWSIRALDAIETLKVAMAQYGHPKHIRSDNGPEFIAYAIQDWLSEQSIGPMYIKPGSPWEQGHIESFHDKLRDECLNRELFGTLSEAIAVLEDWRKEYNEYRPHSSLGYQTPDEYRANVNGRLRSDSVLPTSTIDKITEQRQKTITVELQV